MSIRNLLVETSVILLLITCSVIALNSFQIKSSTENHFAKLQQDYLDTTFEIYKDEITGNILIDDQRIENALFQEISKRRGIGLTMDYQDQHFNIGLPKSSNEIRHYSINFGDNKTANLNFYPLNDLKNKWLVNDFIIPLLLEFVLLLLGFWYLWVRFTKSLLTPLSELVANLKPGQIEVYKTKIHTIQEIEDLSLTLKEMNIEVQKKAHIEAEVMAAKQVGHDIRSPLTCLMLALSQSSNIPEDQRTLMRSAIQRITDITNCLQNKAAALNPPIAIDKIDSIMISSLIDLLISEKRIQIRDKNNISIDLNLEKSYGLFAFINPIELKRVISNVLNNSIESFDHLPHFISVSIEKTDSTLNIIIKDDGKGIPDSIMQKIGQPGFSYGKEKLTTSGTGLGINHAIKTLESFAGKFTIQSIENSGTTVSLSIPTCQVPSWFVDHISIAKVNLIVVLDDDISIYNVWQDKFKNSSPRKIDIIHFTCANEFRKFFNKIQRSEIIALYLIDYELLNQPISGIDLAFELKIVPDAILVTSYSEDKNIIKKANQIGLKIIPKSIAAYVPICH